jgi:hypothetical protein
LGQPIGKLVVSAPGIPDRSYPLKAAAAVERLGFFPRLSMAAGYMLGGHGNAAKD